MAINQRILRVGAIVAVAGATGLVMQVRAPEALPLVADVPLTQPVSALSDVPLAAEPEMLAAVSETLPPVSALSAQTQDPVEATAAAEAAPLPQLAALAPQSDSPSALQVTPIVSDAAPTCDADMALVVQPGAMLDLGVISPCRPNQRVVIRHAGLAVTGLTSAAGTLIASLPALQSPAEVTLSFLDGAETSASAEVPDLAAYDRFAIQWHEDDAFQLRAYPKGFDAGEAEVIAASNPGTVSETGGYLVMLGNDQVPRPLLAEVFTWPTGERSEQSAIKLSIEAAVTAETCAREILGETLQLSQGELTRRDFSIEMPDCTAAGEYVALPNPVSPEKLAIN